ncbi:MAG TPA: aldehyde dehydrogenase family protein [Pseudonocardia sp.]|nr:aldehyde dehydrogenase family protein [Pseudonocardia sp.]
MAVRSFDKIYIDGQWVSSTGTGTIEVISPRTEQVIATVPDGTPGDMDRAVAAARRAFDSGEWSRTSPSDRMALVRRFTDAYERRIPEFAEVISAENGTPITLSTGLQAVGPWAMLNTFLQLADGFGWETTRPGMGGSTVTVRREPAGVVAAIVPWNVPRIVTLSKVAPALLAGCTVVLKPAPETPLDAYVMVEALDEAGLPPGVLNLVPGGRETGEHLVSHPGVDKVAFTGSTAAGRTVARICGEQLKRCSLELGGKNAAIVLDDADLALTTEGLKFASMAMSGQAGSVWTGDVAAGNDIARRVRTGLFGINSFSPDFAAPFGGFKASGIGREMGVEGLATYTELKTIFPPPAEAQASVFTG